MTTTNGDERMLAEQWPVACFIQEEIEYRHIDTGTFLAALNIPEERWAELINGDKGMLLSECEKIGNFLGVSSLFLANMNVSYRRWKNTWKEKP